jgi:hypothetical protein
MLLVRTVTDAAGLHHLFDERRYLLDPRVDAIAQSRPACGMIDRVTDLERRLNARLLQRTISERRGR